MKSLKSFIKAIRKNYYKDFIISPESSLVDFSEQIVLVNYNNHNYYEKSLEAIRIRQSEILNNIETLYKKSISDIYFSLADKKSENIYSIIALYIEALKIDITTLKTDFFVDDVQSRYYSKIIDCENIYNSTEIPLRRLDLDELPINKEYITMIKKWYDFEEEIKIEANNYESFYHIGFHTRRFKVLSYLPFSLWHISVKFIDDLIKVKQIIEQQQEINLGFQRIKWIGKRTHIGFIMGTLALEGYIDTPKLKSGDVNYTAFSKLIKQSFDTEVGEDTLRKYLNPDDEKFKESKIIFEKEKYLLPNVKLVT